MLDLVFDPEFQGLIPPLKDKEYSLIEQDIIEKGCLTPLDVWDNVIIDGHNRYKICTEHGIEFKINQVNFEDRDTAKLKILSIQRLRRNLNEFQLVEIDYAIAGLLKKQAKAQQGTRTDLSQTFEKSGISPIDVTAELAKTSGVSYFTASKAKQIIEDGTEEQKERLRIGDDSINHVYKEIKRTEKFEKRREISEKANEVTLLPEDKKYRVIYADPPWQYSDKRDGNTTGAEDHYKTLSISELCEMRVNKDTCIKDKTEADAVLFIWVTSPMLEASFKVIDAWGFKYKTSFVWDKVKHNMGHYNSVRHEFLLIATKGSCVPDNKELYDSVQVVERSEEHSEKPELFRQIIDKLYTYGNKAELFAKRRFSGWDVLGDEIE